MVPDFLTPTLFSQLIKSLLLTWQLSAGASVLALGVGVLAAFARNSGNSFLRILATGYVELFRNTPLLIQLFFYYRGLQSIGILLEPFTCGLLALGLYTGAYLSEVFRAGLFAVPAEQRLAGLSLGLSPVQVFALVLLPQALRSALPAVTNQLISLLKNSSLVAFITVEELFHLIYTGAVDQFQPLEYFCLGACLYMVMTLAISGVMGLLDALLTGHQQCFRRQAI